MIFGTIAKPICACTKPLMFSKLHSSATILQRVFVRVAGKQRRPELPQELECGSGMTCWRRLRDWQLAGVWDLIHFALLDWLACDDQIDWSRAVVDSCPYARCTAVNRRVRIPPIGPSAGASAI